uniref:Phorbol-ester/DAG-type domain-containing protein n=1 Tax=Macrostomum lignano TaxID=282301 RepID=A0A1I8IWX1_9PLAT
KSGGENGNSSSFWSFFKPSQEAVAAAKPSAALAEAEEITLVPKAAKVHGGDPVLILLPDGGRSVSADCRYCLVYEGTNRRHLASCELAPDRRALFSRVPEHDAPETVRLSLHRLAPTPSSSAQPLLSNLEFSFVPDPMTAVAAAIAAAFPSVPSELAELSACASASAAADCDRQLSDALSRLGDENFNRVENFAVVGHRPLLAGRAGLAGQLRRPGHSAPGRTVNAGHLAVRRRGRRRAASQALLSDSRCPRAALGSPDRLRLWLRAVASACSRRRRRRRPPGPEDAVVRVASWVTPTAAPLVVMTTNLAKSSTASLEQDLALFPGLEASHAREHFHRYGSDSDYDEDAPRETACVQTETGKSMEDLQLPQKRPFDEAKEAASNPETPSMVRAHQHAITTLPVCVDTVDSATSKSVKSATSALALSASARSISTPSLFGDLNSEQQQGRKKRRSFLSRLGSSYRMKHKQQQHQQQHLAVPQTPGDHDWVLVSSGRCAVCEAKDGAGCRLRCRVCQLTVHSADQCRGRVVACLPAIAETPQQGASAAAPAAATAAVKPEVALAVELFKKKKLKCKELNYQSVG